VEMGKVKEDGRRLTPQPALVNGAASVSALSGFDQAQTLDEIEAIRTASYAPVAAAYYAGRLTLIGAAHAREDIDRAADKAREKIVGRVLASLGRAA
jgi:hypothetical protein